MNFHQHWSLLRSPFSAVTTQDAFFSGNPQREAIARMDYMIQSGSRSALMLSHRGCGVTTLLKRLAGTSGFGGSAIQPVMTAGGVSSIHSPTDWPRRLKRRSVLRGAAK
jgi:type II secretory pathway predicted ATPase ExeA